MPDTKRYTSVSVLNSRRFRKTSRNTICYTDLIFNCKDN